MKRMRNDEAMAKAQNMMRPMLNVKIVEIPVARQIIMDTMPSHCPYMLKFRVWNSSLSDMSSGDSRR